MFKSLVSQLAAIVAELKQLNLTLAENRADTLRRRITDGRRTRHSKPVAQSPDCPTQKE